MISQSTNDSLETGFVCVIAPELGMQTDMRHAQLELLGNPEVASELERISPYPDCLTTPPPWETEAWHYGSGS